MTYLHSTRRGILGAMAAIPVLGMAAAPASASVSEWDRAYQRVRALDNALDNACDLEEVARSRWIDACEPIHPPMLTDRLYCSLQTQLHTTPLDDLAAIYEPPHVKSWGGGQAVADAVGAYRQKREALKRHFQVEEMSERSSQAGKEWRDAFDEAVEIPVTTLGALTQKIELLTTGGATDDQMEILLRDAKRVSGGL